MARYILVHGAWHGGWCWEEVTGRLEALGHRVLAPDLPGMGADAGSGHVASLDEWGMFIAGMMRADTEPAILVGHSRGGIVISRAAEIAPEAAAHLVYLAAALVPPGRTMAETFHADDRPPSAEVLAAIRPAEDGRTTEWHDEAAAAAIFYNTSPPDRAAAAFRRLTAEPTSMAGAPLALTGTRYGHLPRTYIRCERDGAVAPALQTSMTAAEPCAIRSLDTDHSPFYSAPDALVEMLDGIGAG